MMAPGIDKVGRRTKLVIGSLAVGLAIGLIGRGLRRRSARIRARKGFRTVASFAVAPRVLAEDAEWETLEGRAFFKRLCVALTMAGYPASDVGDIDTAHRAETVVGGERIFVTLTADGSGGRWTLTVSRSLGTARKPGPPPSDTAETRAFLGSLERTLVDLGGAQEILWRAA